MHNKTPRPTQRIRKARSHFKTHSEKQDKTYLFITRRQDLQDAFERHAPISRRVQKTRQDVLVHNKTPRPTRRIRKPRSHFKTRSEKQDKTYSFITRRQDLQDAFERHSPISTSVQKTRGLYVFMHNKTPRPTRRIRKPRSHFKTRSEKQDKTYSCITRRQDLQEAFERLAPISRRLNKARQEAKTSKMPSYGTLPFQDVLKKQPPKTFFSQRCMCETSFLVAQT